LGRLFLDVLFCPISKLDDGGGGHDLIRTIRNEGYMFTAKVKRT